MDPAQKLILYKTLHLGGIMLLFLSLGAAIIRAVAGDAAIQCKRFIAICHGLALVIILVAGFGLLAVMKYGFPTWIVIKLVLWVMFGGLIAIANRRPKQAQFTWWVAVGLGVVAVLVALMKPFSG